MDFKKAFKLVLEIHEQCGDKNSWMNVREMLEGDVKRYSSFQEFQNDMYRRTDRSQDDNWMLEEMDASIEVLYNLMGKHEKE